MMKQIFFSIRSKKSQSGIENIIPE